MTVLKTPLHAWHVAQAARMVPFAGYDMPVQYAAGVLKEHLHTRAAAGLFDVSHMGQAWLIASDGRFETAARAFETLVPADIAGLAPGQQRYTQLLSDTGGILDDLMAWRPASGDGRLGIVVNASNKAADFAHIAGRLGSRVEVQPLADQALIAVQGPKAEQVLADLGCPLAGCKFMQVVDHAAVAGLSVQISRSGYTGEDGFEISVPAAEAVALWETLAAHTDVMAIGLGARDSLRLEAGLCLHGQDIDPDTSPIEAGLAWSIQKRRRVEGGFPGAERIQRELRDGPARVRVGLQPSGRAPIRAGTRLFADATATEPNGTVTSGGFGPSVNRPVAMGYVPRALSAVGTTLTAELRGERVPLAVCQLPFVPNRFKR